MVYNKLKFIEINNSIHQQTTIKHGSLIRTLFRTLPVTSTGKSVRVEHDTRQSWDSLEGALQNCYPRKLTRHSPPPPSSPSRLGELLLLPPRPLDRPRLQRRSGSRLRLSSQCSAASEAVWSKASLGALERRLLVTESTQFWAVAPQAKLNPNNSSRSRCSSRCAVLATSIRWRLWSVSAQTQATSRHVRCTCKPFSRVSSRLNIVKTRRWVLR